MIGAEIKQYLEGHIFPIPGLHEPNIKVEDKRQNKISLHLMGPLML